MTERFSVGEIGIIALPAGKRDRGWNGREVEILSDAYLNVTDGLWWHRITADWMPPPPRPYRRYAIEPRYLRKRKPPIDWQAYARDLAKKQLEPA